MSWFRKSKSREEKDKQYIELCRQEHSSVSQFLQADQREGCFIEVGANEPVSENSQTWHLEQSGWYGLLIEPIGELCELARSQRPRSQVAQAVCVDESQVGQARLMIPRREGQAHHNMASLTVDRHQSARTDFDELVVRAATLGQLVDEHQITEVDFLSIDVEGHEMGVLRGAELDRLRPRLILLEDDWVYMDKHRYLKEFGYRLAHRTGRLNSWYVRSDVNGPVLGWLQRLNNWQRFFIGIWPRKIRRAIRSGSLEPLRRL